MAGAPGGTPEQNPPRGGGWESNPEFYTIHGVTRNGTWGIAMKMLPLWRVKGTSVPWQGPGCHRKT